MKERRGLAVAGIALALAGAYALVSGSPERWPRWGGDLMAAGLILGSLLWWGATRLGKRADVLVRPRVHKGDVVVLAAGGLALTAGLGAYFQTAPGPLGAWTASLEDWWRPIRQQEMADESRPGRGGRRHGNWLFDEQRKRKLPVEGDFKLGNRPEVFVRPTGDHAKFLGQRVYVSAFALHRYREGVWEAGGPSTHVPAGNDGWIRFDVRPNADKRLAYQIFPGMTGERQPLLGISGLMAARLPELVREGEDLWWLTGGGGQEGYDAISTLRTLDDPGIQAQGAAPPGKEWRQTAALPGMAELARRRGGKGEKIEQLRRVRDWLRDDFTYTLRIEKPKRGDPLTNFLHETHQGHCEFFAAAGALLARELGFASRVVYGWAGGVWYENGSLLVFRARDAHAWAEVWLEGAGWVVMDPTPMAAVGEGRAELAPPGEKPPVDHGGVTREQADAPGGGWLMCLFALAAGGVAVGWWMRRGPGGAEGGSTRRATRRPGDYEQELRRWCTRQGQPPRRGTTVREMVKSLGPEAEQWTDLVKYHYQTRYAGAATDSATERRFVAHLRRTISGDS